MKRIRNKKLSISVLISFLVAVVCVIAAYAGTATTAKPVLDPVAHQYRSMAVTIKAAGTQALTALMMIPGTIMTNGGASDNATFTLPDCNSTFDTGLGSTFVNTSGTHKIFISPPTGELIAGVGTADQKAVSDAVAGSSMTLRCLFIGSSVYRWVAVEKNGTWAAR
jgi:hypothetical protein